MSAPLRFQDPQYTNWLRCASSLMFLKESLHVYTEAGVMRLHCNVKDSVKKKLGSQYQCSACSCEKIYQNSTTGIWTITCKICNVWLKEILEKHVYPQSTTINWHNADITKWSTEPWEIAKIFMPSHQWNNTELPRTLDSLALFSLLKYCKTFHPIRLDLVGSIIDCRNRVFHSPDQRVSDKDKNTWMDCMLSLVSNLKSHGVTCTEILKLKTEDIDINFRGTEIKVLQNLVSEVLKEVKALKGDSESLKNTQRQLKEEFDKVKGVAADYGGKIVGHKTKNQQLETDLRGQKTELETYGQVISKLKTFLDNNQDLSDIQISQELTAISREIQTCQKNLQTVESQLKDQLLLITAGLEALKIEMTSMKVKQEELRFGHDAMEGKMDAVKSRVEHIEVKQEKMRNQIENQEQVHREKQTEIQHEQHIQKDLLLCYRFLNVIPISPLHESYTTLLDDIFTSVIIEKGGDFQEEGQSRNSKQPMYLRS